MKIQCPQCRVKGSADDSHHGQKVKCPKCQAVFVALPVVSEGLTEDALEAVRHVDKPVEKTAPVSQVVPVEADKTAAQQPKVVVDTASADCGLPSATLGEILAADSVSGNKHPSTEASATPVAQKDAFELQDIDVEIGMGKVEDSPKGEDAELDAVDLHDFFDPGEPPVDDLSPPAVLQEGEASTEMSVPDSGEQPPVPVGVERVVEKAAVTEVEDQPYGMDKAQCWQCGKKDSVGVPFIAKDGRLYCSDCLPPDKQEDNDVGAPLQDPGKADAGFADMPLPQPSPRFAIGSLLKEAWIKTKGAKATIWAGSAVMYLVLIFLAACGTFLLPSKGNHSVAMGMVGLLGDVLYQMIFNVISAIFSAGLLYIGIRKVADQPIHWKMIFEGFSVAGKLIVATILQSLLIFIGFLLFILPGIYLAIGYAMTVPLLIVDRKLTPWQAMEMSRKAIHPKWWKIFGLFLIMGLLFFISSLPLGLGLIWIWPMSVILGGVVYCALFGTTQKVN